MLKRRRKIDGWFTSDRTYLHFDRPVSFQTAFSIVSSSPKVAKWNFYPFLRVSVDSRKIYRDEKAMLVKRKPKPRSIMYASHMDSNIYAYYAAQLQQKYDAYIEKYILSKNVLAFRKVPRSVVGQASCYGNKCNIDFAKDVFDDIKSRKECVVLSYDVKAFFDEIDHNILKKQWANLLGNGKLPDDHFAIYRSLTRFAFVEREEVFSRFNITRASKKEGRTKICSSRDFRHIVRLEGMVAVNKKSYGIPQGSSLSGLLSNIYLAAFDKMISNRASAHGAGYYRYCDDIIIVCDRNKQSTFNLLVNFFLTELKLKTNEKTMVTCFQRDSKGLLYSDNPLQYLGFMFDGSQATIRSSSHGRFLKKMRRAVSLARQTQRKYNWIREGKGLPKTNLYKRKLYTKYSYLGNQNYINYAHRAAKLMNEPAIRRQVKPLWGRLKQLIAE